MGTSGEFTGNVSVGGTLTYADVSNVDAVGVITARDGIKVGAGESIKSDLCIGARSVEFRPLVRGVVAVAVRSDLGHVESCSGQLCGRLSGEHPAELVGGDTAHA